MKIPKKFSVIRKKEIPKLNVKAKGLKRNPLPRKFRSQHEEELYELLKVHGFPLPNKINYQPLEERKWTIDLAYVGRLRKKHSDNAFIKVGIEVHGSFRGTVHKEVHRNAEKRNYLTLRGWKIVDITPQMLIDGAALETIFHLLDQEGLILWEGNIDKPLKPKNRKLRKYYTDWILNKDDVVK